MAEYEDTVSSINLLARRCIVPVIVLLFPLLLVCQEERESSHYQTCTICGSTRALTSKGDSKPIERILYRSPRFAHGEHVWREGIDLGVPDAVRPGVVVLVKRVPPGSEQVSYGAFILTSQPPDQSSVGYRWYLRSDGAGGLDPKDPAVRSAEEHERASVTFGPFKISVSGAGLGAWFLYYDHFAHVPADRNTTYLCVTKETDPSRINAADPKWTYKFSPAE